MIFFVLILSVYIFIEIARYAFFEYNEQQNKPAGIILFIFSLICSIGTSAITLIKY